MDKLKLGIIISNSKDQKVFEWLLTQCSKKQIQEAINHLAGARKPYLSNIVKQLGLSIPNDIDVTDRTKAREYLKKIRASLV